MSTYQVSHGLVNSRTGQLAKMVVGKFGVYNFSKCDFWWVSLFVCIQYSIGLWLGLVFKYSVVCSSFKKKLLSEN